MNGPLPAAAARPWIVSRAWDLSLIVLTPALIVPAALAAVGRLLTPEQFYLAVISFASLGHHLPGFMRAYGDRELFRRFRWRFLLAPPAAYLLALAFMPPDAVAAALGVPWRHLHGLELILLLWGTWHGLMQTYGCMRIYDLRRGDNQPLDAWLDWAMCLSIFFGGLVLSDHRMFSLAMTMSEAGLTPPSAAALQAWRWAALAVFGASTAAYLVRLLTRRREGVSPNAVKLLLGGVTGWFYWYCGRLSTNPLIGLAMFEIYHAIQYDAIVWAYNRRRRERAGDQFGLLGFLFRDRPTMVGLYLAAIVAYSLIRYVAAEPGDTIFSAHAAGARQWLAGWFVASSLLHFYIDGFIWKVSQRPTGENLVDVAEAVPWSPRWTPAAVHAVKCAALAATAAWLLGREWSQRREPIAERDLAVAAALAEIAPSDPQYHAALAETFERLGRPTEARRQARRAAELAPDDPRYVESLAVSLLGAGRSREALAVIAPAAARSPEAAHLQFLLGHAELAGGNPTAAIKPLQRAIELEPTRREAHARLGDALLALGKARPAAAEFQAALDLDPASDDVRIALAQARLQQGDLAAAEQTLRDGLQQRPDSADLQFSLGSLLQASGRADEAAPWLHKAHRSGLRLPTRAR